jgi:cytochrome c oxidase assembly factor CtaG
MLNWTADPTQVVPLALVAVLYATRVLRLRRRGRGAPRRAVACFAGGVVVLAFAVVSPIDTIGEERLFWMHMLQHVLIGDVAPLLIVLGLTGPLLRPVLALPGVIRLRALAHPLVALPLWAADLAAWHVPALYDAALETDAVHALEHACFFAFGAFLWAALLEPLPGPEWFGAGKKIVFVIVLWFYALGLSQLFIWSTHPFYPPYVHAPRLWGTTPLSDQRLGGGVMLVESSFVMLGALVWVLLRWWSESEQRQRLLDEGVDPRVAARAARYGRAVV